MSSLPQDQIDLEAKLLAGVAQGDRDSFEELYDRFAPLMTSMAWGILKDHAAVEDTVQEAFIQIWRQAGVYDPARGKPLAWALTLVRHRAIDRLRKQKRELRLEHEVEEGVFDADPQALAVAGEEGQLAMKALQTLRQEEREVIMLTFFHALTQSEIAERLVLPLGTVKARLRRGLIKLRSLLSDLVPVSRASQ